MCSSNSSCHIFLHLDEAWLRRRMLWQHNKHPSSFKKNIRQHEELMKQIWVSSVFERCLLICSRPCLQNHKVLRGSSGYWLKAQMIRVNCNTRKALFPSKGEAPQPQKKRKYHCYDNCPPFSFWISFFLTYFFFSLSYQRKNLSSGCGQPLGRLMLFLITSVQLWLDRCTDSIKLGWVVTLNPDILQCCC